MGQVSVIEGERIGFEFVEYCRKIDVLMKVADIGAKLADIFVKVTDISKKWPIYVAKWPISFWKVYILMLEVPVSS